MVQMANGKWPMAKLASSEMCRWQTFDAHITQKALATRSAAQ
jgi:hypothetical protein